MAQYGDRSLRHHCQGLHVHREGVHLHPVNLVAGEGPRQRVDGDVLRLDVARGLVDLPIEAGDLDLSALGDGAERRILPEQRKNVQAAISQFLERDAVMLGYGGEADMNFFLIILGAEIEGRTRLGHRAQPILRGYVGDILHQLDDAFAGAAFAGEYTGLLEGNPIPDCPLALRYRLMVPCRHIEPLQALDSIRYIAYGPSILCDYAGRPHFSLLSRVTRPVARSSLMSSASSRLKILSSLMAVPSLSR